jgi:hypothetical protein
MPKWNGVAEFSTRSNVLKSAAIANGILTFTKGDNTTTTVEVGGNTLDGQILEVVTRDSAYSSGSYEGDVIKIGSGTLVANNIYVLGSDGGRPPTPQWNVANAGAESTTKGLLGIALGTSATSNGLLTKGIIYYSSGFNSGEPLYISTTNGGFTTSSPNSSGNFVRVIGYALSNDYIYINPSQDYLEIA